MWTTLAEERTAAARLTGAVEPCDSLDGADVERLFRLFSRYYRHVDHPTFERDWNEKDWVLLLRDDRGAIRGFTTMKLYEVEVLGRIVRAVFNGNTIIDQNYWGEQTLVQVWCEFMAALKSKAPTVPLYWYLISSGYRTYLYLPLFFRAFFPRHDQVTPLFERKLIDFLGRMKFPSEYEDGIVRVAEERECLLGNLAPPSAAKLRNRHVQFFVEKNSGYRRGDELVCLAEFSLDNTRRTAHRALLDTHEPRW